MACRALSKTFGSPTDQEGDFAGNVIKKIGGVLNGGVPLDVRLSFTDRQLGRELLAKLLSWNFDELIVAHGSCLKHDAKALTAFSHSSAPTLFATFRRKANLTAFCNSEERSR
jgi:hypothetical protein